MKGIGHLSTSTVRGYTLTEVMIAMAVMAVTIPIALGLVIAGGESSRQSERTTRAVMTARSVFEELRRASNGSSAILKEADLPWSEVSSENIGESEDWLIFEVDSEGRILGVADEMEYGEGWSGDGSEVTTIAAVRGMATDLEGVQRADGETLTTLQLELRVESPARAQAAHRKQKIYYKTDSGR